MLYLFSFSWTAVVYLRVKQRSVWCTTAKTDLDHNVPRAWSTMSDAYFIPVGSGRPRVALLGSPLPPLLAPRALGAPLRRPPGRPSGGSGRAVVWELTRRAEADNTRRRETGACQPNIPDGEPPAKPSAFCTETLSEERGWLAWAPHLVLAVELEDVENPAFLSAVASRMRRLKARVHPDRYAGDGHLSR